MVPPQTGPGQWLGQSIVLACDTLALSMALAKLNRLDYFAALRHEVDIT